MESDEIENDPQALTKVDSEHGGSDDGGSDDDGADFEGNDFQDDEDAFSLEELGAAYKHIVAQSESDDVDGAIATGEVLQREDLLAAQAKAAAESIADADAEVEAGDVRLDGLDDLGEVEEPDEIATPEAIIEAALFVGQPSGDPISPARLASIMRDMTIDEVNEMVDALNTSYRENRQGIRVAKSDAGYSMVVAPEAESMRHVFTGKVRETRLNQASIEVLSLVAYQPGITSQECTDLRGRDSGSLLNQMVRRRLIEMRREPEVAERPAVADTEAGADDEPETPKRRKAKPKTKMVSRFYPAERLLVLLGLESLEDLPQVEEVHLE